MTEDKHGKFYIDCAQRPKPTRIHPVDITPLDKDTESIMHQNLQKWCFPSKNSKRVQQRGIHKFRGAVVSLEDDDVTRAISAQDLTKLGLHINYAHSISLGYSKEKYYLILVVDGIDFVWGQTCTTR